MLSPKIFLLILSLWHLAFSVDYQSFCNFPKNNGTVIRVRETIVLKNAGIYDYKYAELRGDGDMGICPWDPWDEKTWPQSKRKNLINIEDGVTLKNVIIDNSAMGIFCFGSCTLENVYFKKNCFHAGVFWGRNNGDNKRYTFKVKGGAALNGNFGHKIFNFGGMGSLSVENFCAANTTFAFTSCTNGSCMKNCPNNPKDCQHTIKVTNSKFYGPFMTLTSGMPLIDDQMVFSNVQVYGQGSSSTAVKALCSQPIWNASITPVISDDWGTINKDIRVPVGADPAEYLKGMKGNICKYKKSDIKVCSDSGSCKSS